MSMVRCETCEHYIDTDFDAEHFIEGTEEHFDPDVEEL